MKHLLSLLDRPLIASPVRRRWSAVALYLAALWVLVLFAVITATYATQPRGAPVSLERMTWVEGEWRFRTDSDNSGKATHTLFNAKADLELTICSGQLGKCHQALFPKDAACWAVSQEEVSLLSKRYAAAATCNQLIGSQRYNGRYWVAHYGGAVGVAARIAGDGSVQYLFRQPLVRPDPNERRQVLHSIAMVALGLAALFLWLRYGLARLAWTWRDSLEDATLLAGMQQRATRWRVEQ